MKQLILVLLLMIPCILLPETQASVSLSTTSATIGEQILLKFIVRTSVESDTVEISPGEWDFDFIQEEKLRKKLEKGTATYEKIYRIAFFKTGDFTAGPFRIQLKKDGEMIEVLESNTIPVTIRSVLEEQDKDIRPLRELSEIRGNPLHLLKYVLIILVAAAVVILVVRLLKRKKTREETPVPPPPPPDIEFLNAINSLWRSNLLKTGKIKPFFLQLTAAYKRFITRGYNFNAEDLTTYEITGMMTKHEKDSTVRNRFDHAFLISDLAKFAKYIPSENEVEQVKKDLTEIAEIFGAKRMEKEKEDQNAAL